MNKQNPIIIIEDDIDDQQLFASAYEKLGYKNEVLYFDTGELALEYLKKSNVVPFIIISDINMPKMNGFMLRDIIRTDADLATKCIPYLFFTTASTAQYVMEAYALSAQGYFIKPTNLSELCDTVETIMKYWKKCAAPSNFG